MRKLPVAIRLVCGVALITMLLSSTASSQENISVEKLYQNGERAFRACQLQEAKKHFRSVLTKLPRHAYSQNYLAKITLIEKKRSGGDLANKRPVYSFDFNNASFFESIHIVRSKIREGGKEKLNIVVAYEDYAVVLCPKERLLKVDSDVGKSKTAK